MSTNLQREGSGQDAAADTGLQEQAPGAGDRHEDADRQLAGRDEVPVTRVAPSALVQPFAPGAQTCVWK